MASLVLTGDTSGQVTIAAPAVAGTNTLTLQAATATNAVNTLGTAVASTSGTSIDFTGLPAWIKRITVMLVGVSTSGTSLVRIQIGDSGGIENTGYASTSTSLDTGIATNSATAGFDMNGSLAAHIRSGNIVLTTIGSNIWVASGLIKSSTAQTVILAGDKTLSDVLTQVRITTVNGTDTFDAGSVNILYEG